jgi:PEP-CTERM motif
MPSGRAWGEAREKTLPPPGELNVVDFGDHTEFYDAAVDTGPGFIRSVNNSMFDASHTIPISIDTPFSYSDPSGNGGHGFALFQTSNNLIYTWAYLDPTSVTVTIPGVASVPEPSTWAMMLLGFAGLCFVFRQCNLAAVTSKR